MTLLKLLCAIFQKSRSVGIVVRKIMVRRRKPTYEPIPDFLWSDAKSCFQRQSTRRLAVRILDRYVPSPEGRYRRELDD